MRQRRHTYNRDAERRARLAKLESDPAHQASLLQATAWCPLHACDYPANHMVGGHVEAQLCPHCMAEQEWLRKARLQLVAEGTEPTTDAVRERAEALAGQPLRRYQQRETP